jgi:hypothetical protein
MRVVQKSAAVAGATAMLGAGLATTAASTAPASSRSVKAYNTTSPGPWNHPATRPRAVLAPGYATWGARHLSWPRWGARSASGHGQEFQTVESQTGDYITTYNASVSLWDVKSHHGLRYFAKLKISAHGHKTIRLTMRSGTWA